MQDEMRSRSMRATHRACAPARRAPPSVVLLAASLTALTLPVGTGAKLLRRHNSWKGPRQPIALAAVAGDPEGTSDSQNAEDLPAYDLVIIIPSHASEHRESRAVIRETWAQYATNKSVDCGVCRNHSMAILFVVGQEGKKDEVKDEAEKCKDLAVLEDYTQSGSLNRAEMTQRSIRYAVEHTQFKLLLKVDVHSWVFIDRLLSNLEALRLFDRDLGWPGIYAGHFTQHSTVELGSEMQHRLEAHTGSTHFPRFADGAGYLLTPDLCEFIAGMGAASEDMSGAPKWGAEYGWAPVPRLLNLPAEDVSLGFWLQAVNHTKVQLRVSDKGDGCQARSLVDSPDSADEMYKRWGSYLKMGSPCAEVVEDNAEVPKEQEDGGSLVQMAVLQSRKRGLLRRPLP